MQPVLNLALMRLSASTISGRRSPCSSGSTSLPRTSAPSARRFGGEQLVEGLDIDLGALEFRPGVFQMIGGVGAADDVGGQAALALEPRKGLERRGGQHPAEIPDHRLDHHSLKPHVSRKRLTRGCAASMTELTPACADRLGDAYAPRAIAGADEIRFLQSLAGRDARCRVARSRHRRRRGARARDDRPLRRHHRRLARQFLHRQPDRAHAGADGRALRAARRRLQDRAVRRRPEAAIAGREEPSPSIPASGCRRCWRIAPPPMSRCCGSPFRRRERRRRGFGCRSCRLPPAAHSPSPASASPCAATARAPASIRSAALVATGKPGTLQIRLVDPATQGTREGLGACTGDSGCAGVRGPAGRRRRSSASSAGRPGANGSGGCGGITGVTPLTLYRDWILQTARQWGFAL